MANDKTDMTRVGLFKEMKYISVNDPYVSQSKCNLTLIYPFLFVVESSLICFFSSKSTSIKRPIRANKCCPDPSRTA